MVGHKLSSASELETEIVALRTEIARLSPEAASMNAPMRSVDELQSIVDDQIIQMEKKRTALEQRRRAIARLQTIHNQQQSEFAVLAQADADLATKVMAKEAKEQDEHKAQYSKQLGHLADWYKSILSLHSSVSRIQRIELVRPDYILVTLASPNNGLVLPVHLKVCPSTGKLVTAQVGSTSNTPKRQWKEMVDAAVEFNNIPYLIRQIYSALSK